MLACLATSLTAAIAKDVPFKGWAAGRVIEAEMLGAPTVGGGAFMRERAEAEGVFTRMGATRISLEWLVSIEVEQDEMVYLLTGEFTVLSASGETMTGTFWSRQKAEANDYDIEVTVTHGNGRFAGCHGVIAGKGLRVENEFSYYLDGWLSAGQP